MIKDIKVRPTPAVQGELLPQVHSNLSWMDAKGAFVTCQKNEEALDAEKQTISYDEFLIALGLCGHIKYEGVEEMSLGQCVAGVIANYLGEKDEQAVITEASVLPPERFDPKQSSPVHGQLEQDHIKWMATWVKMGLAHVYGFPLWEEEVFHLLQVANRELHSIFTHYGRSDSSSSAAIVSLQQTELTNLALDCGLALDTFPMARVQAIFTRAEQTDDKKGGNKPLEFHEFLEAVVTLSFHRANPKFGQEGSQRSPEAVLPECLQSLLTSSLLKIAKRGRLSHINALLQEDPDVQKVM